MHHTHDPGTTNHTEGAHAANKLFVPELPQDTTQVSNTVDLFTDVVLV